MPATVCSRNRAPQRSRVHLEQGVDRGSGTSPDIPVHSQRSVRRSRTDHIQRRGPEHRVRPDHLLAIPIESTRRRRWGIARHPRSIPTGRPHRDPGDHGLVRGCGTPRRRPPGLTENSGCSTTRDGGLGPPCTGSWALTRRLARYGMETLDHSTRSHQRGADYGGNPTSIPDGGAAVSDASPGPSVGPEAIEVGEWGASGWTRPKPRHCPGFRFPTSNPRSVNLFHVKHCRPSEVGAASAFRSLDDGGDQKAGRFTGTPTRRG